MASLCRFFENSPVINAIDMGYGIPQTELQNVGRQSDTLVYLLERYTLNCLSDGQ